MKIVRKIASILLLITIIATMLPLTAAATTRTIAWGAANAVGNGVRIRAGAGLNHDILTQASRGDAIVILERTNSEWYRVNYRGTVGFVSVPLLERPRTVADFNASGKITGDRVNMRERPDINSTVLGTYVQDTIMSIIGLNNGWFKVRFDNKTGYVRSDFMSVTSSTASTSTSSSSSSSATTSAASTPTSTQVIPTGTAPDPNVELGQQIADLALSFIGTKYVYGGASPSGFDCSGLVSYVFRQFGVSLTRNSAGQYRDNGTHIKRSELSVGDLIFTSENGRTVTHVAIYIGDNKIVHSARSSGGVLISDLGSAYYTRTWFGAKRIV
ncbi:MAG: C40 family peptidase [Oscillospiraceae bacterium]|nr:C40 family peptidase [Oscillospiraceae bacterium]